jgi:tetratricopeptide (TPR) repeat protein
MAQLALKLETLSRLAEPPATETYLDEAQKWLTEAARRVSDYHDELATFLARRGRYEAALDLVESRPPDSRSLVAAAVGDTIVRAGHASPEILARTRDALHAAIPATSSPQPRLALAKLHQALGDLDQAEAAYRAALQCDERNLVALNNLAMLLVVRNRQLEEADALLRTAMELAGRLPGLLDSRAMLDMARGNWQQAGSLLDEALQGQQVADFYFHQAVVLARLGRYSQAIQSLAQAEHLRLEKHALSDLEQRWYKELLEMLKS